MSYAEAVEEALCFGWIDSKPNRRDAESYYQFFSPRSPKSRWSRRNKDIVEQMAAAGKMTPAGQVLIDEAKRRGTWQALDRVEQLIEPDDLLTAFTKNETANQNWGRFPPSARRGILEWILSAKRETTRAKRIAETVAKAACGERANSYRYK